MAERTITATFNSKQGEPEFSRSVSAIFNSPESIEAAVERFSEEVVLSIFNQQAVVKLQGFMRSLAHPRGEDGSDKNDAAAIQALVTDWRPSTAAGRAKRTPLETVVGAVDNLDVEGLEAVVAKIKERKAALRS